MQTAQRSRSHRPAQPAAARGQFALPSSHHLNVTTARHVHALDEAGPRVIFTSKSEGIVAAKETLDGSGTLAISDSVNVILHRVEGGLQTSYRLKGSDGQIRLLEFSPDSKSLFFTTTLLNSVQAYSLTEGQLLNPGPLHSSIPTVVAVSPGSRLLLTASEEPSSIYLQDRALGTQPLLIQPAASLTTVVQACFHPDRPSIFLLGFKDGTAAVYDATKLCRNNKGLPQAVGEEVHTFRYLHAVSSKALDSQRGPHSTSPGARCLSITGSSFVSGYRSHAVTCGADGRCRLLDFEIGVVIRSWHVRAPATAMSVLPSKSNKSPLIAIGKIDGKVAIHDLSGSLLHEWTIDGSAMSPTIDVQWIKGPSPIAIDDACEVIQADDCFIELYTTGSTLKSRKTRSIDEPARSETCEHLGDGSLSELDTLDDDFNGTICYKPVDDDSPVRQPPQAAHTYMDLFSPLKPMQPPPALPAESPKRRTTPRPRPRILSTTFINSKTVADERSRNTARESMSPRQSESRAPISNSPQPETERPSSILAGIRQHRDFRNSQAKPGSFALFAPYLPPSKSIAKRQSTASRRRSSRVHKVPIMNLSPKKSSPRKTAAAVHDEEELMAGHDDIWLTAESEDDGELRATQSFTLPKNERSTRRSIWSKQSSTTAQIAREQALRRPSIELQMSLPIARSLNGRRHRKRSPQASRPNMLAEASCDPLVSLEGSMTSSLGSADPSEPTFIPTPTPSDTGDETILASPSLRPGFAQSFQGPVSVGSYLPRKSSLAFPSSPAQKRTPFGSITGNEQNLQENEQKSKQHDEGTCLCCSRMRDEIQALRDELAELKWLVKGKCRVDGFYD